MITATYYVLNETQPGYYQRGESTDFGTEHGEPIAEFENETDALYELKSFLCADDVTVIENFVGWGIVLRTETEDGSRLYSVDLNN